MPHVEVHGEDERVAACVRFALGLGEEGPGLPPEVFVELLVPKWDPARKGEELGAGCEVWEEEVVEWAKLGWKY